MTAIRLSPRVRETDWRAGLTQRTAHWQFSEYLRLDNLTNRTYVGSVIVNQSNAGYYEAAPGRTALLCSMRNGASTDGMTACRPIAGLHSFA